MADIIDLKEKLQKDFYTERLYNGLSLKLSPVEGMELKYLLRTYLEEDFIYETSYDVNEDVLTVLKNNKPVILLTFTEGSHVYFTPPLDFMGQDTEVQNLCICLVVCDQFIEVYLELYGPQDSSTDDGNVLTFPIK